MNFRFSSIMLILGLVFLYIPILILIIYSFNSSNIVTVWGGFSTKWYGKLFEDTSLVMASITSIKVGSLSATLSVILGTLAGYCLARIKFFGKPLFSSLLPVPFVIPEVITGFSLLLLFVSIRQITGWSLGKGIFTIVLAHTTIGLAYVALMVQVRLSELDESIEEAARDLGATPLKIFFVITLPSIMPAIISGWLLSFTLSIDDLVLASFSSLPGATTLPMLIYSRVRMGVSPEINVLATFIIALVLILLTLAYFFLIKNDKSKNN